LVSPDRSSSTVWLVVASHSDSCGLPLSVGEGAQRALGAAASRPATDASSGHGALAVGQHVVEHERRVATQQHPRPALLGAPASSAWLPDW